MAQIVQPADSLAAAAENLKEIFGDVATLAVTPQSAAAQTLLTNNLPFRLLTLGLFVYYLFTLSTYGSHIGQMLKIIGNRNVGARISDELSVLFITTVKHSVALGLLAVALSSVKAMELSAGVWDEMPPSWLAPLIVVTMATLAALQWLATSAVCRLTRRDDIAKGITILAGVIFGFMSIIATPAALLFVLNTGTSAVLFGWALMVCMVAALVTFTVKSLIFFIEQNVSILLWFLYLCTVILIPIGSLLTLVLRTG